MKDKIFAVLQRVGRSFMLPIAILPVAGLLLGIGGSFTNTTMLETYHLTKALGPGTVGNAILTVMSNAGDIVFGNLPIIFAIGVAIGMAKKEKEVAALAAAIAFLIMHASIGAMITIHGGPEALLEGATASVCGITSLQMGVFGGMIVGLGVAALHNKYYKIQLPQVLSFFGGTRFVPIISGLVYTLVGILMFFVWPFVQQGIYAVGAVVLDSGYAGTWVYGLMERLLIPFGLHHVFYLPFWQTAVGGTLEVGGQLVEGAQNIFFAQLADPTVEHFAVSATRFMSGKFPLMIFGLPGAALAMYRTALPEKRKEVGGLLLSAALTSMLTGITEPIEFTFLFVAPLLYGIHCVFAGAAYMLMHMCGVGVGMTFSGGLIDLTLFGILPGNARTSWIWVPIVGVGYFIVYYLLFSFLIKKLDLKTPGRDAEEEVKLYRRSDYNAKKESVSDETSEKITNGLGGKANISDVDCCATRLRCTVHKAELVNDALLKSTGASGVVHKGNGVQIIYGPHVTVIKSNLEDYLETAPNVEYNGANEVASEEAKAEETSEPAGKLVKTVVLGSPLSGTAADLSETPDEVFAQKMMGEGAVVTPANGKVCAPADGTVVFVFDTKHAIGFATDDGVSMLLHFGIDTVKLQGQGFNVLVTAGQKVKKGDVLMEADLEYISNNAPSIATPVICTELKNNQKVRRLADGAINAGDDLLAVDFYE
ncbi:MAG: glucose PTS transporter subunit IIA [Pseudobutyrivibrio sp.]|nr:glucose PTS transporter subunit IIA [Pseudobutyrivibrio sp.]